jgi:hypothetical protein
VRSSKVDEIKHACTVRTYPESGGAGAIRAGGVS